MILKKFNIDTLRSAISAARISSRMTQQDAAHSIGCNRKWISDFERGLAGSNLELVISYARLLGFDLFVLSPDDNLDLESKSSNKNGDN